MTLKNIFPKDINFNFQANRLLSYGDLACDSAEIYKIAKNIKDFDSWFREWKNLAETAEEEGRYVHSMYYYRMAEFMLKDDHPAKDLMYDKMQAMFTKAFPEIKRHRVPFQKGYLPCIYMEAKGSNKTILLHGGYDSFIEEFYLLCQPFVEAGYNLILFEGEGQGGTLRQGMKFNEAWENSVTAILNHFSIKEAALIGISWGGYFALRAAAYTKRITHAVCFDVLYDGLDVQMQLMKEPIRSLFRLLYKARAKQVINFLVEKKMKKDQLANWGISHGMYITGTNSPYEFYQAIEKHTLKGLLGRIDQQVLLLAGEEDHYVPTWHFAEVKKQLSQARVTARLFTKEEKGEQHCRVGNYSLAIDYILNWLQSNY